MNYYKQIAEMLGVELGEEFKLKPSCLEKPWNSLYRFSTDGLENKYSDCAWVKCEKATPKKPTEADASEENSYCAWLCPTCGRTHINNYPLNYCSDCGQKIDWSDYDKYLREGERHERNKFTTL